jgi:hypothetical protein
MDELIAEDENARGEEGPAADERVGNGEGA